MATYVLLLKDIENDNSVVYKFGFHEEQLGKILLDKATGTVKEIEPLPTDNSDLLFPRAAVKIRQHWREGKFPEKSCWAS